MFLFYSSSLCFVIVVINWKWESRFLKIVNYFYFYRKKPSWILKIRTCKGRTINLVIKEDRSSAFGCNHTDFVTGNSKFWCHDALQCSFLFRNTWLAAIWRDFFQLFLSSIWTVFGFRFLLLSVFFHFPFGYGGLRSDQPAFPSPTSISFNLSRCQKIHGISNQKYSQLSLFLPRLVQG